MDTPGNRNRTSQIARFSLNYGEVRLENTPLGVMSGDHSTENIKLSPVPYKKLRLADSPSFSVQKVKPEAHQIVKAFDHCVGLGVDQGLGLTGRDSFIQKEKEISPESKNGSAQSTGLGISVEYPKTNLKTKGTQSNDLLKTAKNSTKLKKDSPKGSKFDAGLHVQNKNNKATPKYSKSENQEVKSVKGLKSSKHGKTSNVGPKVYQLKNPSPGRNVGTSPASGLPKPDWPAIKKQKKEIRLARKQKRSTYNITVEGKQLWEILRNQNNRPSPTSAADMKEGIVKMHNLLKTHLEKLVMCHDMSRVVQWLIKMATPEIRLAIVDELKPFVKKIIVDRYACKCLESLLKHGTNETGIVIVESCLGLIVKLMSNVVSHSILEKAYAEYATNDQKRKIHSEFYSDLYKSSKDSNVTCLTDTYKNTPDMKKAILASTKANITRVLNKNTATNQSTLLYTVMLEFLNECTKEDRDEILTVVRNWISDLPSNKEAGQVGMLCVWHATNKEKKAIGKGLKGNVMRIAQSKHLQLILFAVFSLVDDTVLLSKVLFPEVIANLKELGSHDIGRKLIVHLVSYGDARFFHPIEMKILKEGEASSSAKKDHEVKRQEILHALSKPFLESVAEEPEFWLNCTDTSLTAFAILTGAEDGDDKQKAFLAVAKHLIDPTATSLEEVSTAGKAKRKKNAKNITNVVPEIKPVPLVAHCAVHRLVGLLLKEKDLFAQVLAEELTNAAIKYWIPHNRGCFNLLHLLETGKEPIVAKVKGLLKSHQSLLDSNPSVGAKILIGKLNSTTPIDKK